MTEATNGLSVLGISGSLRAASYNTAVLRAAAGLAPHGMTIDVATLHDIPFYNADIEREHGYPEPVVQLRERMDAADGLLIATPEYNFSVPGVLKNAIDWASRGSDSPLNNKPLAILGAGGRVGTLRAQLHLRDIALHNHMATVDSLQVMIDRPFEKFDDDGNLTDDRARDQITRLLQALAEVIHRHR
jgi:chromate reductase